MEEALFENLNEEFYLSSNSKWDVLRKVAKKEDEPTEECKQKAESGVQLLPRQDVLLFGMLPKMEQRVYSKCRECRFIFNPRDILKHQDCTARLHQETIHPSLLKKQQKQLAKAKANSNKKPVVSSSTVPPQNPSLFKKPRTPPPIKPKSLISRPPAAPSPLSAPNPLLELKVSVAKVVVTTAVTSSTSITTVTVATSSSSDKHHEPRVSSSTLSSTATKTSSGHHSPKSPSKSSSHSLSHNSSSHRSSSSSKDSHKSPSKSTTDSHSSRRSSASDSHSSKSASKNISMDQSLSKSSKSFSLDSPSHSSRSTSKSTPTDITHSHKSSSHSESHTSSRKSSSSSSSTSTVMDTLPAPSKSASSTSSSSSLHHHSSRHSTESRSASNSSSSRHKKSKKSNNNSSTSTSTSPSSTSSSSKGTVFDPDLHCGVVEGSRGPCTRSITCSNHRIQLRKLVPGRSKDIHQLIAERKAAKEKDSKQTNCSYTGPNAEAKDSTELNTSYVFILTEIVSTAAGTSESPATVTNSYVPIMPKVPVAMHPPRPLTTSKLIEAVEKEADSPRPVSGYVNQTTFDTSPQDVYMPMSPISVTSPVQFVKIGNKMMCLESPQAAKTPPITRNSPIFIQIPMNQPCPNIRTKSHPKPARMLTYGTKKLGGAILFSNRRPDCGRSAILSKLRPHGNKTANKRPSSEEAPSSDNKKMVSEVNGFFLHVDMSEATDSTQSGNLIQEKILLSMK